MAQLTRLILTFAERMAQRRRPDGLAAGDRQGTPEARAKRAATQRNLTRNRRALSVLRRP